MAILRDLDMPVFFLVVVVPTLDSTSARTSPSTGPLVFCSMTRHEWIGGYRFGEVMEGRLSLIHI